MVYVSATLEQLFAVAIMDIVAVIGAVPLLVGVNTGIFPVPKRANPIAALEFVHAYVVPDTPLVNTISVVGIPLQ
jgi:hypothetical protein